LDKLRVGVIGCGGIARVHTARLAGMDEVRLVAFADVVKEKAAAFSREYGGNIYTDWHEMLDRESLDIVYICIPPFAHTDEVMVAAEKGIHIFIEKPIALDVKLAREMVRAVDRYGVKSQVGYVMRFKYSLERAKKMIEGGEVGRIGLALGIYWCHFLGGKWWRDKSKSGGQIVEQATHIYDALRYLCGDVEEVYGYNNRVFWIDVPDLTIEDVSSSTFRFKSGAVGSIISTTWGVPSQWWFRWLLATEGYTLESADPDTLTMYRTEAPLKVCTVSESRDGYTLESKDLIKAIKEDGETRIPISEGAKSLEFTLAAMRSMETGKPVRLPLKS